MFLELRDIPTAKVPFVSATPIKNSLDTVLASIEGPPKTPCEGVIFCITVRYSQNSEGPLSMRFNSTRRFPIRTSHHKGMSVRGTLKTGTMYLLVKTRPPQVISSTWQTRTKSTGLSSLGALLTAWCGLQVSPHVDGSIDSRYRSNIPSEL